MTESIDRTPAPDPSGASVHDAPSPVRPNGLWLDDLEVGMTFTSGRHELTEGDIIRFARTFDPQPFHVFPDAAADSFFAGLAASGWHTAAVAMQLLTEALPLATGIIGGGAEVAWPTPARPGDDLSLHVVVEDIRTSRSRPGRGTVTVRHRLLNQHDDVRQETTLRLVCWRRTTAD